MSGSARTWRLVTAALVGILTVGILTVAVPALPATGQVRVLGSGPASHQTGAAKAPPSIAAVLKALPNALRRDIAAVQARSARLYHPRSIWVLVGKRKPLRPRSYIPPDLVRPGVPGGDGNLLRAAAASAVVEMFDDGETAGAGRMRIVSGYRSYATQVGVYGRRAASTSTDFADQWIARPGYSEHQTGLSLDIGTVGGPCATHTCLGSTPQGAWLRENSWRYGFILRYEDGRTDVTGYRPEAWHFRFVGKALAADYHAGEWHTWEDYLRAPAAPTY